MNDLGDVPPPAPIEPPQATVPDAYPAQQLAMPQPPSPSVAPSAMPPVAPETDARPLNTLAVVSLATAFVVSIVAVVTGHVALSQIKRRGESGRGLAIAGVTIGYFGVVASIAAFALILVFVFRAASLSSNGTVPINGSSQNLTFSAGQKLAPSSTVAFVEPTFSGLHGWRQTKNDYGDGSSQYASSVGKCTIDFARTPLSSVQLVKGDDQATSDNLLAMLDNSSYADVATYADTVSIALADASGGLTTDMRAMGWSSNDGSSQGTTFARAFTAVGYGLSFDLACADKASMIAAVNDVANSATVGVQ